MISTTPYGVRVILNSNMTIAVEDWSQVRSPGRARRRRPKHRQRIRVVFKPDPSVIVLPNGDVVMHPEMAAALEHRIAIQRTVDHPNG